MLELDACAEPIDGHTRHKIPRVSGGDGFAVFPVETRTAAAGDDSLGSHLDREVQIASRQISCAIQVPAHIKPQSLSGRIESPLIKA
jgi:hypothetical protein